MRWSRRGFVACGCGLLATAGGAHPALGGCHLRLSEGLRGFAGIGHQSEDDTSQSELLDDTGDPQLNRALGVALGQMAQFFEIRPGVGLYDDGNEQNAWASSLDLIPGMKGTVGIGRNLLRTQLTRKDNGVAVLAVVAHEFAHILQLQSPDQHSRLIGDFGEVILSELNADFFAGLYLARYKARNPDVQIYDTGQLFHDLGDTRFGDPRHHGTPAQRVMAIEFGFKVGSVQPRLTPKQALKESVDFVRDQFASG